MTIGETVRVRWDWDAGWISTEHESNVFNEEGHEVPKALFDAYQDAQRLVANLGDIIEARK